ncbi:MULTISPECIES: GNAT family N-acetyltransferase [unclassified Haladaptatus]|uniref:GNAT family N-acetyltransferase n=1 Tax=unclassified Haladaptatus TaxID=2622732 RepID=UPI0023E882B8|nr:MULTISPECIES: GNAT family N-acetyltransferase [unclassified Haladaptatus]
MSHEIYPEEVAGPFEKPPRSVTDKDGREIAVETYDGEDVSDLVAMYTEFDPADRAQGIPPVREEGIREWLENIVPKGYNVVARNEGDVIGHATLVPDGEEAYELAIFVLHDYQGAGIGSALLTALLGEGAARGVEKVWLTVERWNAAAIGLYHKVGFETSGSESFELEMSIRLN